MKPPSVRVLRHSCVVAALLALSAVPATPAAAQGRQVYAALGDSMASGPLIPDITGPVGCGRSTHNYAHELDRRFSFTMFRDVTCSGAETRHLTEPQSTSVLGHPTGTVSPQFTALSSDTTLVTLTIGGNDAGLIGVANQCVNLNPFATPCKTKFTAGGVDQVAARVDAVAPKIAAALDGIRLRAPRARVLVTGYGLYIKPGGCWPLQPVLPVDADYLQGNVFRLNDVIAGQAKAHGATYVDVAAPSAGHDSCQAPGDRWIEGYVPTDLAAPLHPNRRGEAAYARIVGDVVGRG
ncbi:SGNH/GDSL hydrolase family protein [Amycolatopsis samaneae]|uniref:SGNH/GDSL hydrolase family protein n=1 Tax=Amycolatopsis samaneae TaxID=664691 RepID=A0ABW5GW80_9PSEU